MFDSYTAAEEDDDTDRAQRFWEGDYTPLPQAADTSPVDARKVSRDTSRTRAAAARGTSRRR